MRTVIYLDVLLLVNFVVGGGVPAGGRAAVRGVLFAAAAGGRRGDGGGVVAGPLAPTAPWPLALTYKGTSAALCVAAAYGWQGARNTARLTAWFILLNLTLTGALFLPGAACNNLSFYLPVSPGLLLASTAGVCGGWRGDARSGPQRPGLLWRPGSRWPGRSSLKRLLRHRLPCAGAAFGPGGGAGAAGCRASARRGEGLSGRLPRGRRRRARPEWGVRFVPCQTVAGHCLLPALPAALASNGRKQEGIYAAFCDMPPSPGGGRLSSARKRRRCWANDNTVGGMHLCFNDL